MTEYLNTDTGELIEVDDESTIEEALTLLERDQMILEADREAKRLRSKVRRLESQVERDKVKNRDKALWTRVLEYWQATFPDKKITAKGHKSARATAVFLRVEQLQESMSDVDAERTFKLAIRGAMALPYVVYGKRRATGSTHEAAIDLTDIASVTDDRKFDALVEAGENGGG